MLQWHSCQCPDSGGGRSQERGIPYTNDFAFNPDNWIEEDRGHGWKHHTLWATHRMVSGTTVVEISILARLGPDLRQDCWPVPRPGGGLGSFSKWHSFAERCYDEFVRLEKGNIYRQCGCFGSHEFSLSSRTRVTYCARRAKNMLQHMKNPYTQGVRLPHPGCASGWPLSKYD